MKISEIKKLLINAEAVSFKLQDGTEVPEHFHVTEIGITTKHFIDCGGKTRTEQKANFQLWNANDFDHRLKPQKLLNIIRLCEQKLNLPDLEIEVEYQSGTIGKYGIDRKDDFFVLTNMETACLANDACGIPQTSEIEKTGCTPGGGCC